MNYTIDYDYRCTIGGETSSTTSFQVLQAPAPGVMGDTLICETPGQVLQVTTPFVGGPSEFQWCLDGIDIPGATDLTLSIPVGSETGVHTYQVKELSDACNPAVSSPVLTVDISGAPSIDAIIAGAGTAISEDGELSLEASLVNASSFQWLTPLGASTDNPLLLSGADLGSGSFTIQLRAENAPCIDDVDSIIVLVRGSIKANRVLVSGDPLLGEWVIEGIETFPDSRVTIYNKWGNVVFETFDYESNPWFGQNQRTGNLLPEGVYYFTIMTNSSQTEQSSNANAVPFSGHVTLVR